MPEIKILNGALETDDGMIILRGVIDPSSLGNIKFDKYQREDLSERRRRKIYSALEAGSPLPDTILGMRGKNFRNGGSTYVCLDNVFAIDGRQRINTALEFIENNPGAKVHIGTKVIFGTNREIETELFKEYNSNQNRLNTSVLLRNDRSHNLAIAQLYGLTENDRSFPLYDKVSWDQNMKRGQIMRATVLCQTVCYLHSARIPGTYSQIALALKRIGDTWGLNVLRENTKKFFGIVDEIWGLSNIQMTEKAIHLKPGFLFALALVFSDYTDFWEGNHLHVSRYIKNKLKMFKLNEPSIMKLAITGGSGFKILAGDIVRHLDWKRQSKRLKLKEE